MDTLSVTLITEASHGRTNRKTDRITEAFRSDWLGEPVPHLRWGEIAAADDGADRLPREACRFLHECGQTGRAGRLGRSTTLIPWRPVPPSKPVIRDGLDDQHQLVRRQRSGEATPLGDDALSQGTPYPRTLRRLVHGCLLLLLTDPARSVVLSPMKGV